MEWLVAALLALERLVVAVGDLMTKRQKGQTPPSHMGKEGS